MEYALHADSLNENQTKDVESLLSSELMRLSINDRTAIEEEIHGVSCLAPEETPQFLDMSLRQLLAMLNDLPSDVSVGYRQSQGFQNTYVNSADFLLRFLRCELFDVQKAALRIAKFLDLCIEYFGVYALQRPIMLSDFNKEELKYFRSGRVQFLPFRDRSGRRVAILFPGKEYFNMPEKVKVRAFDAMGRDLWRSIWHCFSKHLLTFYFPHEFDLRLSLIYHVQMKMLIYTCWAATECPDTQRKGFVLIVWYDKTLVDLSGRGAQNKYKIHELSTCRVCAAHICTPDTPYFRFRRACAVMRAGSNKVKMRMHVGNTMELIYILQAYGIPTDVLPITYSGTVKVQPTRQWMRLRNFLEEPLYQNTEEVRSVVECPYSSDIVFRQGTSILTHPGNNIFRSLIASKYDEIQRSSNCKTGHSHVHVHVHGAKNSQKGKEANKLATRILVKEIMEEMERTNMRVLNWDDRQGFWRVLHDKSQIYVKVEYLVREHKNSIKAMSNRQWTHSSTSAFCTADNTRSCFCPSPPYGE